MADYVPSKLFKFIANDHLKSLFEKFGIVMEADWEKRKPTETNALSAQWGELKADPGKHKRIGMLDDVFQDIRDIAEAKTDSSRIIEELVEEADPAITLPKDFIGGWNRFDQAAYIFLYTNDQIWLPLRDIIQAEEMSFSRKWTEYTGLPMQEADTSPEGLKRLEKTVTSFFAKEKKCHDTHIECYPRYNESYLFFATLDDAPQFIEMKSPGDEDYGPTPAVMPYRIIFSYNYAEGEFSLYAPIASKEMDRLAAELIKDLVGHSGDVKRLAKATYNLDALNKRDFSFTSDPADMVTDIHVKALSIAPPDNPSAEITFKDKRGDVYARMDEYLDRKKLPDGHAEVQRATITMRVDNPALHFRTLTFEVSRKTCTLKSLPESKRQLGEKLIKKWGFKNACGD